LDWIVLSKKKDDFSLALFLEGIGVHVMPVKRGFFRYVSPVVADQRSNFDLKIALGAGRAQLVD
jgi:hypothetical protein